VVHAGEEEPALLDVLEEREQGVGELAGAGDQPEIEGALVEIEERVQQERVVVEVGVQFRLVVLEGA